MSLKLLFLAVFTHPLADTFIYPASYCTVNMDDTASGVPKPVAVEPCSGGKAAVLTVLMRLPSGPTGLPPPGQSGFIVASALIDVSQQKASDFKDKSQALKNRKALAPTHQGTCV
ncbi:hypothetical protein NQD34_014272 [Periophthalmus magnuspinnatus]|nr:hypothetical protein NQD34_014272 [Periophthalmus magnuspinnatus]